MSGVVLIPTYEELSISWLVFFTKFIAENALSTEKLCLHPSS